MLFLAKHKKKLIDYSLFKDMNAVNASKFLLGKLIQTEFNHQITSGIIIETEAYLGAIDKACHAFNYKKTKRNMVMFEEGGFIYVYLCYGLHYMLNIVVNKHDIPEAVLIRSLIPFDGIEFIRERRNKSFFNDLDILIGPGNVTKGLGIDLKQNYQLIGSDIKLFDVGIKVTDKQIIKSPRIGIDYSEEWKDIPLNFKIMARDLNLF